MKKAMFVLAMVAALVIPAIAQEPAGEVTEISGRIETVKGPDGQPKMMLRLANKERVAIELPEGEAARLQLKARDRVQVKGVLVGTTDKEQVQARILARSMVKNGKTLEVKDPVQLTERDREQIRAVEEGQLQAQTQTRSRTSAGSGSGSGSGNSGASSSAGAGSGAGGSGAGKK
jgi:hypothetical protein